MLERKAYGRLLEWKEKVPGRALLVEGARQVGKTYLVGEFARREFGSCVKVGFLHDAGAAATFAGAAGAALKTNSVAEPKRMLARTEEPNRFKLHSSDTGMLFRRYPVEVALDAVAGAGSVNFGGVYENAVAQELASARVPLRYYRHSRRGEVDFLAETGDGVVAIEVKSGKGYKLHTALNTLLGTGGYDVGCAYVLSEANISVGERAGKPVYYVPLYLAPFVVEGLASEHAGSGSEAARVGREGRTMVVAPPDFSGYRPKRVAG